MDNSNFTITKQSEAPDVKFEVEGYIIYDTAVQFEKALSDSIATGPDSITLDMEKVTLFTSVGIRVILKTFKATDAKGIKFHIINPSDTVRSVMDLSSLTDLLVD